ncbi:MAG TPA: lipase family protein [Actinomycetota bacterium]|nr:lipase family protein [Actinomycetota bacterium]
MLSSRRPSARVRALLFALALLLAACGSETAGGEGQARTQSAAASPSPPPPQLPDAPSAEELYRVPADVPAGEPGRVVRLQELDVPDGLRGWRILYHSTAVDGRDIVVSGLVFAPAGDERAGRPVVTWGHGSVGLGDACAPSRFPDGIVRQPIFRELLNRGFVVTATDYEGLGTPGVHPWLVGQSEGRGMLDIVRAARQIPASGAGSRVLAFGASQGGGAALFAGELAGTYARDLELLGVVAAAPAAELDLLALLPQENLAGVTGFVVMGAFGFAAAYPDLPLDRVLQPEVLAQRTVVESLCQDQIDRRFRSQALSQVVRASPGSVDRWAEAIAQNTPGRRQTEAPVLLVHGNQDRVVPVEVTQLLFDRLCRMGVPAERQVYGGVDHGEILSASRDDVLEWIGAREDGRSPESREGVQRCS